MSQLYIGFYTRIHEDLAQLGKEHSKQRMDLVFIACDPRPAIAYGNELIPALVAISSDGT